MSGIRSSHGVSAEEKFHANLHIPSFLNLFSQSVDAIANGNINEDAQSSRMQVLQDGRALTAEALLDGSLDISRPILVQDTPESIGMTVFRPPTSPNCSDASALDDSSSTVNSETATVRHIADVIGHLHPVRVMDVEHQEELDGWTLGDLVDYFEDEGRLQRVKGNRKKGTHQHNPQSHQLEEHKDKSLRSQRKAKQKASGVILSDQSRFKALNQISLEFSDTPLRKMVLSPQFVRDLDWIDKCWPLELKQRNSKKSYPSVQYYCLTSTSGCYTDFHLDFGGTAVWYHVLSGCKQFCLIKPTKMNFKLYEEWLMSHDQETQFLVDRIPNKSDVLTVTLLTSQTLYIPTGWIHAVYTPDDSIVLGGNFLHGLDLPLQLEVDAIESRTKTPEKFRFPYFKCMHFYVVSNYLHRLRKNDIVSPRELEHIPTLLNALEIWMSEESSMSSSTRDIALAVAKTNGCSSVSSLLQALRIEHQQATSCIHGIPLEKPTTIDLSSALTKNPFGRQGLNIVPPDGPQTTGIRAENSLGGPKSPKIRLKLSMGNRRSKKQRPDVPVSAVPATESSHNNKNSDDGGGFRITISSTSKELHKPLPRTVTRRKSKFREEMEFVDLAKDDDDWLPTSSSLHLEHEDFIIRDTRKQKRVGSKVTNSTSSNPGTKRGSMGQLQSRCSGVKKAKTTSRQRLLKKFR